MRTWLSTALVHLIIIVAFLCTTPYHPEAVYSDDCLDETVPAIRPAPPFIALDTLSDVQWGKSHAEHLSDLEPITCFVLYLSSSHPPRHSTLLFVYS